MSTITRYLFAFLIIAIVVSTANAGTTAPTTWHPGHKLWGTWWDLMGEIGIVNGTIGGEGKNITLSYAIIKDSTLQNVTIQNGTSINVTTINATNFQGDGSRISNLNLSNVTGLQGLEDAQNASSAANRTYFQNLFDTQNTSTTESRINDTTHDLKFNNVNTSIDNVVANNTAQATYDNTTFLKIVTANAMNVSNAYNQSWTQSLFDWLNITALPLKADGVFLNNSLTQQATNNTAMNVSSAANRTYAQEQSDNLNNSKLNKSGDTMTGTLISSWINDTSGNAYLKNVTVLNTSTITVSRHSNGSIELVTVSTVKTLINVTQNYTIGAANTTNTLFTCHANSGTLNITLPTGVAGTEFSIKKKDATGNICSVFSGQNIDGARYANISTQYESIDVVFTSDEWSII